ncbi:unnamed protein product, partial [Rotaria sp. Silwood2]
SLAEYVVVCDDHVLFRIAGGLDSMKLNGHLLGWKSCRRCELCGRLRRMNSAFAFALFRHPIMSFV